MQGLRPSIPGRLAVLLAGALLLGGTGVVFSRVGNGGREEGGTGGGRDRALQLRLNAAIGAPGSQVALVVRTSAALPIRQGQMTLRLRRRPPANAALTAEELRAPIRPLLQRISATVYSSRGDARNQTNVADFVDGQTLFTQFSSASGTINGRVGPLAVLKFFLDPAAIPGDVYDVVLDPASTSLVAADGGAIDVEPLSSTLTIRALNAPVKLEAEGGQVSAGATAELGVNTFEPFPSLGGRITLRYPAGLAAAAPAVRIDSRYGKTLIRVDSSRDGRLVVDIVSRDGNFNSVPGRILAVSLPIKESAGVGEGGAVTLDPAGTYLLNRLGRKVGLRIENGGLTVE